MAAAPSLTYAPVGATAPASAVWTPPPGLRASERTAELGSGDAVWTRASAAVLEWGVKTRSGFDVASVDGEGLRVAEGRDFRLTARLGPIRVREPVRVVAVVAQRVYRQRYLQALVPARA